VFGYDTKLCVWKSMLTHQSLTTSLHTMKNEFDGQLRTSLLEIKNHPDIDPSSITTGILCGRSGVSTADPSYLESVTTLTQMVQETLGTTTDLPVRPERFGYAQHVILDTTHNRAHLFRPTDAI
jgi:hypothetical protein